MNSFETTIKESYLELRSIYIVKEAGLEPGKITVLIEGQPDFSAEGKLNSQGILSGMAKLYKKLSLKVEAKLKFSVTNDKNLLIEPPPLELPIPTSPEPPPVQTVFEAKNLRYIHIEPFRPENLDNWEPENETDVYLAFGVLQDYTDYQYCCAASQALLNKLGAKYENSSKPDAILIDRASDQYLMAEWKKLSSDFKSNHKPEDVDVLVCWIDDETERGSLPKHVLALHSVAKKAAQEIFTAE